jgi:hypothetical protein
MLEKRKLKRRHPVYYLKVVNRQTNESLGYLLDINVQGMMLAGKTALPAAETVYDVAIQLPSELNGEKAIFLKVVNLWSEFDPQLEKFKSGFHFQDSTAEEAEKIKLLIEKYGFKN